MVIEPPRNIFRVELDQQLNKAISDNKYYHSDLIMSEIFISDNNYYPSDLIMSEMFHWQLGIILIAATLERGSEC